MTDYTQSGEQIFLEDLPDTGRFLDIGAYDGLTFSNTRALAERGWTGVWVEPGASQFDGMVSNELPGVTMINALIGETTGLKKFHYCRDAVSSTEDRHAKKWGKFTTFHDTYVCQVSVDDLMAAFPGPYDLISIDTEGTSLLILGLLEPYLESVETIVVEHDGLHVEVPGFKLAGETPNNLILRRK